MMFKPYHIFLLALLFPLICSAQQNYKKGYVLTLKGDTVNGYVDFREWDNNPSEIHFKKQPDAAEENFTTINTLGFGINNAEYYQRFTVPVSINKIGLNDPIFNKDTASVLQTVFLKKMIVSPKINLYSYADAIKTRYYYQEKDLNPVELHYSLFSNEDGETHFNRRYRAQLTYLAFKYNPNNKSANRDIEKAEYNENDLTKVIDDIVDGNNISSANNGINVLYVGAGLSYSKLMFFGIIRFTQPSATDTHTPVPFFSVGYNYYVHKTTRRLFFAADLTAFADHHKLHAESVGTFGSTTNVTTDADLQYSQFTSMLNLQAGYNIIRLNNVKIFGEAGFALVYSAYGKHDYVESYSTSASKNTVSNYPDFTKLILMPNIKVGVTLGTRLDIFAAYYRRSSIFTDMSSAIDMTLYQAGVHYALGK